MKLIKVISLAAFAVGSFGLSSCGCCTGEAPVPPLRPLPVFKEIPTQEIPAQEIPVTYEK